MLFKEGVLFSMEGLLGKGCCLRRGIGEVVLLKDGVLFKEGVLRKGVV